MARAGTLLNARSQIRRSADLLPDGGCAGATTRFVSRLSGEGLQRTFRGQSGGKGIQACEESGSERSHRLAVFGAPSLARKSAERSNSRPGTFRGTER